MRRLVGLVAMVMMLAVLIACSGPGGGLPPAQIEVPGSRPEPTAVETPAPTPAATPVAVVETPVPTPMPTQAPSPIPAQAQTPVPTAEPTAPPRTPTPVPAKTPAATPTPAETPAPTITPAPTPPAEGGSTEDPRWEFAIKTLDGATLGVVTADSLNIRSQPRTGAPIVGTAYGRHPIPVYGTAEGDPVGSNTLWYRVGDDQFVAAAFVDPLVAAKPVARHSGHWVDINLSSYLLTAYDGEQPVYAAIIIVGKEGYATPTGDFTIQRRVADETMDAATLGIPKNSPNYYYLPHVKWTQYFTGLGHALHTNYWSQPWQYGTTGSHGCVNLQEPDALYLWNFLKVGSPVSIHY